MLYTNIDLKKREIEKEWGTLYQFEIGEIGRGRKMIYLPCAPEMEDITEGLHKELSIGQTKAGKPRIIRKEEDHYYMILSSEGGYTRRGDGFIQGMEQDRDKIRVLARGNGADGDAGRIGTWDCVVLEILEDTMIRVRKSGFQNVPSEIYIVKNKMVHSCTVNDIEECSEIIGYEIPDGAFTLNESKGFIFNKTQWFCL